MLQGGGRLLQVRTPAKAVQRAFAGLSDRADGEERPEIAAAPLLREGHGRLLLRNSLLPRVKSSSVAGVGRVLPSGSLFLVAGCGIIAGGAIAKRTLLAGDSFRDAHRNHGASNGAQRLQ